MRYMAACPLQADEPLGQFMDYCTYGHMIDNVVLIVTGTLHERDVHVRARCFHTALLCASPDVRRQSLKRTLCSHYMSTVPASSRLLCSVRAPWHLLCSLAGT